MSGHRPGDRQDYLARIRYTNALPPPPFAPKLLDVASSSLSNGRYTSPSFASRLAREQALNIECDAELGMKIDLVGLPGVFDGDERAIMYPEDPPPLDPRDKALLKPLSALGKGTGHTGGVTFLRRTELITGASRTDASSIAINRNRSDPRNKKPPPSAKKDTPEAMLRAIQKSFALAYPKDAYTGPDTEDNLRPAEITIEERKAWEKPQHPTKPGLQLLDSYPIIPDVHAVNDSGSFMLIKYQTNPTNLTNSYEPRLDSAILVPQENEAKEAQYAAELARHEEDPDRFPKPVLKQDFTAYLPIIPPHAPDMLTNLKRKLDVYDESNDSPELYTHGLDAMETEPDPNDPNPEPSGPHYQYQRLRAYETHQQYGDMADHYAKWNDTIAIALHDSARPAAGSNAPRRQKAAYVYPIGQRSVIRPKRKVKTTMGYAAGLKLLEAEANEGRVHGEFMEVRVGTWNDEERQAIEERRQEIDPQFVEA